MQQKNIKTLWITVGSVIMILIGSIFVVGITNSSAQNQGREMALTELLALPGTVLAKGGNANAGKGLNIRSYSVEKLEMPGEVTARVPGQGENKRVSQAWRVTLEGGPFPVLDMPAQLLIDGKLAGYGVENRDLSAITFIVLDQSLVREGATLGLSYGVGAVELKDKLHLDPAV